MWMMMRGVWRGVCCRPQRRIDGDKELRLAVRLLGGKAVGYGFL